MILAGLLEPVAIMLGVITPLVAVALTIVTFYLRSLREHQVSWHADFIRRIEGVESSATNMRRMLCEYERDYTTKEEWLREYMHARRILEQLTETTVRIETTMQTLLPHTRAARYRDNAPAGVFKDTGVRDDLTCCRDKDDD